MELFEARWDSLKKYVCPEWFRDAKFGIWAHWGPQAVPMVGDWYARRMYMQNEPQYQHHCRVYGHPSKVGYKDIVTQWKAEKFDPEALIDLYKNAGARYFVALAVHHDNFDCWDSSHHQWNSAAMGPGKDIISLWAKYARQAGLYFGVSEHLERALCWFNTNKGADADGPYAGIPYDGNDPKYRDFYLEPHPHTNHCYPENPSEVWMRHWLDRITDLIEKYSPDFLYTDGGVPFGTIGLEMIARFYNHSRKTHNGKLEAVYTLKNPVFHTAYHGEYQEGIGVLDMERGVVDDILPVPWHADTCIGGWFYDTRCVYKKPGEVIHMLADVVSKNGNFLLSIPLRPEGVLDEQGQWTVNEIGKWMHVNAPAIYETRPWTQFGEGPTKLKSGALVEHEKKTFTVRDFRFTCKGNTVNVIAMQWAKEAWHINALAGAEIQNVTMLGLKEPVVWEQTPEGIRVIVPERRPCDYAYVLQVKLK
jgi:alpha-L-fucosidase